jgi:hypothetical protein
MAPSAVEVPLPVAKSLAVTNGVSTREELKSPASPLPEVRIFDAATATVDELVDALRVAGGLVVRNVMDKDELASLERDIRPELEKDTAWADGTFDIDCFPTVMMSFCDYQRLSPPEKVHTGAALVARAER